MLALTFLEEACVTSHYPWLLELYDRGELASVLCTNVLKEAFQFRPWPLKV